ncbi:hypothetical protein N2384_00260 [Bacillus paralicheniformis]|nr:hypothetical protein [Bacillus paralicheniformis]UWS61855.1 hypothetical protein N2384_00260 [Bacillus paralicheniformis]
MSDALCSSSSSRISRTSVERRTNDAAMKSTPCSIPNMMSLASFSVIPGRLTLTPGTFTPFLFFSVPLFKIFVLISCFSGFDSSTSNPIKPSSSRMIDPADTSSARPS